MIDFALDLISFGLRYGLSWLTLGLAVLALFKSRMLRKRFNKYLPPMLRDEQDSEVGKYVKNQQRIESKLDLLLEERGITWNADTSNTLEPKRQMNLFKFSILSRMARSIVLFATKHMRWRKRNMRKFKSRKFILAIVGALLIVLNEGLDMGIDSETVLAFAGLLAVWISGESYIDGKRAEGVNPDDQLNIPIEPPL